MLEPAAPSHSQLECWQGVLGRELLVCTGWGICLCHSHGELGARTISECCMGSCAHPTSGRRMGLAVVAGQPGTVGALGVLAVDRSRPSCQPGMATAHPRFLVPGKVMPSQLSCRKGRGCLGVLA